MRRLLVALSLIFALTGLTGCAAYVEPAPVVYRPYYYDPYYCGPGVVVVSRGYYGGGYYHHWR
jgi:hypothetical protein